MTAAACWWVGIALVTSLAGCATVSKPRLSQKSGSMAASNSSKKKPNTEPSVDDSPVTPRRLAILAAIIVVGLLAAFPFRSADSPTAQTPATNQVSAPLIGAHGIATDTAGLSSDATLPMPRRVPFAGVPNVDPTEDVVTEPRRLSPSHPSPPPTIADRYEPLVVPTRMEPTFLETGSTRAYDTQQVRSLAQQGRWPMEARPLDTPVPLPPQPQSGPTEPLPREFSPVPDPSQGVTNARPSANAQRSAALLPPTSSPESSGSFVPATREPSGPRVPSPMPASVSSLSAMPDGPALIPVPDAAASGSSEPTLVESAIRHDAWSSRGRPSNSFDAPLATPGPIDARGGERTTPAGTAPVPAQSASFPVRGVQPHAPLSAAPPRADTSGLRWRVYKVRDGDSLRSIAISLLGDANRAWELQEANREVVLPNGALPLGAVLVVPPAGR